MADTSIRLEIGLKLTPEEFRLVSMALGGVLAPGGRDATDAVALGVRLLEQRKHQLEALLQTCSGALDRAREKKADLDLEDEIRAKATEKAVVGRAQA